MSQLPRLGMSPCGGHPAHSRMGVLQKESEPALGLCQRVVWEPPPRWGWLRTARAGSARVSGSSCQGIWGSMLCPSQASMSHLIPAWLQDFSPWLFAAGVPFPGRRWGALWAALGMWLLARSAAVGAGDKGRCVSLVHPQPGSLLPRRWDGRPALFLSSLVCVHAFCSLGRGIWDMVSLPPALVTGGRLAGSSMTHTWGVPQALPKFWLTGVAWMHGQQGRLSWLCPQRALRVARRPWLGSLLPSFPGLCPSSSPRGTDPSKKVPGRVEGSAGLWHPAHFFPKCPLPTLAS